MKKALTAIILSIACLTAPIITVGCKAPQSVVAYKTLAATQAGVATAREAFGQRYKAGKVTQEQADKAVAASAKFNAAYNGAITLGMTGQNATPASVAAAATEFLLIVSTLIE